MIKYPCGAGGIVADDPSGKESTYKLGNSFFHDNRVNSTYIMPLYPAAYYATNISVNAPNLGKGNWWIPSVSEMAQMMRDITNNTSFWETKPDIVNTVITKINHASYLNNRWSHLSPCRSMCTSSLFIDNKGFSYMYYFDGNITGSSYKGCIYNTPIITECLATPITIYEF